MISRNVKNDIYDYLFCLLILALPYSLKLPNIILLSISLFFIFDYKDYNKIDFSKLKTKSFLILYGLIFYEFIKGIVTATLSENKYSLLLPVVLIPFLFLKIKNIHRILFAIIIIAFFTSVRSICGLFNHYIATHELLPFEGEINEILGMERPYLGFLSILAIMSSLQLAFVFNKNKYLFIGYSCYMSLFVFLISARISTITLMVLIILYLLFYVNLSLKKKIVFFVLITSLPLLIILVNKNLRERFFITTNIDESFAKLNRHEPRIIIWPCAYEIANSPEFNPVFGLSSEKKIDALLADCYGKKLENKNRAAFFIDTKLNTHCQFIAIYISSGIIGLLLLVSFFISQFIHHAKNYIAISILITLFLFFVVENVLQRQLGIYFFIFVVSIVNSYPFINNNNKII